MHRLYRSRRTLLKRADLEELIIDLLSEIYVFASSGGNKCSQLVSFVTVAPLADQVGVRIVVLRYPHTLLSCDQEFLLRQMCAGEVVCDCGS
jgi:hypothetical protein